jgi:hypothetical protein
MTMQKFTIGLPADVKRSLETIATKRGISVSAVAREALYQYFAERPNGRWPHSFGMVANASFDLVKDEKYLQETGKPD